MKAIRLIISLGASFSAAALGSLFTFSAIPTWYAGLEKPFFSPPNWLFAPVWTLLYLLIGVALYLYWQTESSVDKKPGYRYYASQLVLNALWSILFFGLKQPELALVGIVVLWVFILLTITAFRKVSPLSSMLLWPYLAWVTFATLLNAAIVVLN